MRNKKKAFPRYLMLCLAAALLGLGAKGAIEHLNGYGLEFIRPDLLIAFGIGVFVYFGSSDPEEPRRLPEA